ncbi:DUF507 family protein [Candidatus Magnetomonas plexicatena]|uniref:DUF507 family protein n=1 Tax=Candidatus Magnetomonas plexicatena TaxID=2552947 RepID=UPI001C768E98|nr:DUF507 family protein [Nitrospirales bacterium LBB_01]
MRVQKAWVGIVAADIVSRLLTDGLVTAAVTKEELVREVRDIMMDELMAEDRVNEEVRELLKSYEPEIEKGRMDYKKLFDMTKHKLIRERNIVI